MDLEERKKPAVDEMDEEEGGNMDKESFLHSTAKADQERYEQMRSQQLRQLAEVPADDPSATDDAAEARLHYLLKQTEVFTHFLSGSGTPVRRGGGKSAVAARRKMLSEREEDEELMRDERDSEGMHSAGYHTRLLVQPTWIKHGKLREYQMQGLNWLVNLYENNINGILADEMGLGKTLQTISLLGYLKFERGVPGPHLVIVPKSTLTNWKNEFTRWVPALRVFKFHATKETRAQVVAEHLQAGKGFAYDVVCTTYEMVTKERSALSKFAWQYIIIDEAHRIKNEDSLLSQVVRMYSSRYRLLVTGTPLQNNLHELWALLNFLLPEVFSSASDFDSWFDVSALKAQDKQIEMVAKLHKVLRPFMLRRKKVDVERSLPPKKEIKLYVGLAPLQRDWYISILNKDLEALNGAVGLKGHGRTRLLNMMMQLRKCANHPYLFDGAEPGPPFENGEHIVAASGKLVLLDKLLPRLKARDSRVLIFSQMTRMLDLLDDYFHMRGYAYCRIDGSTSGEDRDEAIEAFNAPNSEKFAFLLSTRAGGLGINLATADTVILYDSDWNPQMDLQAQDRAHRIGQTKPVMVYRFVTEGTVEEKITERADAKLHLDALVIQQGRLVEQQRAVTGEELLSMVRFGADQIFKGTGQPLTDEDIDAIIARGEERTNALNERLKSQEKNLLDSLDLEADTGSLYVFEGKDFNPRKRKDPLEWLAPQNRIRKAADGVSYRDGPGTRSSAAGGASAPKRPNVPKSSAAKLPVIHEWQFFPARLVEILDKESASIKRRSEWEEKQQQQPHRKPTDEDDEEKKSVELEPSLDELTEDEKAEKAALLKEVFSDWTRREYMAFVKASEMCGSSNYAGIAESVGSKSEEEVRRYAKVFWQRLGDLRGGDRIQQTIERGEERIQKRNEVNQLLLTKVSQFENPWRDLTLLYPAASGGATRLYSDEEDRFLICAVQHYGFGAWDAIRREIRRQPQFRFDWFFKTRSSADIQRRVDVLIRNLRKEIESGAQFSSSSSTRR